MTLNYFSQTFCSPLYFLWPSWQLTVSHDHVCYNLWHHMLASCLVLLLVPVVTSFFDNQILKIASPCDGPVWMWVPQLTPAAWLIHCSLSSHSHFILPCLDIWWRRWMECERGWLDSGYYNASVSAFSLAGGIHLILPWMMWLRLPSPPPHSDSPSSIHVPNTVLSVFQGEYQLCTGRRGLVQPLSLSAYTFPEKHMSAVGCTSFV